MPRNFSFRVVLGAMILSMVGLISVSIVGSAASSPALRRYPYLTDVVGKYATINWATDQSETAGAVRFGKADSESCTAHYVPATKTAISVNGVLQYQWKAQLTLEPATQYCYRVYLGTSPKNEIDLLGSDTSPSFWTQVPAGATGSFSFLVFGDWGQVDASGTNPFEANLMSLIASSGARFAITTGDNGYPSGTQAVYGDLLQSGGDISAIFGPSFWKVPGSSMPLFPTLGNHGFNNPDVNHPHLINWPQDMAVSTSGGRYRKETYCCLNGSLTAQYPSAWYAFDAGPARFYLLEAAWSETNIGTASEYQMDYDYHWAPGTAQYEWLKADLAAHPSGLKFAFFHYPLYSDNPQESSDTFLQGNNSLEGLLKKYGVNIAFTGHAHIYERNLPSTAGIVNYITGGGGATPGTLGTCTTLDAYAIKFTTSGGACGSAPVPTRPGQLYHFLKVTVNGTHVTVTPIDSLGQTFDEMTYDFSAGAEARAPTVPANLRATVVNGQQINLSWSAATDNSGIRGYSLFRDGVLIDTVDDNTLNYSDTNLAPATTYVYTIDAFDGSGNHSAVSAPVSVTTPNTATYIFTPVADAYVAGDFTTINYGSSETLRVNGSLGDQSYLRFKVNDIQGSVTGATLRLYATSSSAVGYRVYNVTSQTWEEGSITFANAPAVDSEIGSSDGFSSGAWTTVDLTSLVKENGIYDLALSTTANSNLSFSSREASAHQPQLVIRTTATPLEADLALEKSVNNSRPQINTNVVFTVRVTNQGPEPASGVQVTDQLPSGFTYVSSTPSQGIYNGLTGIWTIGDLTVNGVATLEITATVNITGSYKNTAEISASQLIDPDSTPNNADPNEDDEGTVTITPRRGNDLGSGDGNSSNLVAGFLIPVTGYAPGVETNLTSIPTNTFDSTPLSIEIPTLAIDAPIVGVPYKNNTWDVSWLWDQAGWLQGTAYPTFPGNSVITGHLVTADGKPGPFYNLRQLKLGEYIMVDNGSFRYVYKVMTKRFVRPTDESILDHKETTWLTLVTCDSYDIETGIYLRRLVIGAQLVSVLQSK